MRSAIVLTALILLVSTAGAADRDINAYVVNTSGETLSRINLETGQVENNILTLGSAVGCSPNQILVRDNLGYVVVSITDEIQIIDLELESTLGYVSLPAGSSPFQADFYDQSTLFVSNFVGNTVSKVDVETRTVLSNIPVGTSPEGILVHKGRVYVAVTAFNQQTWQYGQGKLVVLDPMGDSVLTEIHVGKNPQFIARDSQDRLHVVCTGDYFSVFGKMYLIDTDLDVVIDSIETGGFPGAISIGADDIAYVAAGGWVSNGELFTYHALTGQVFHGSTNPLPVDSGCMMAIAYTDSTSFVGAFKDYVTQIDSAGNEINRYPVGDGPVHLDINYLSGDLDGDFVIDISDLVYMVAYMFSGGDPVGYPRSRINVDGSLAVDIADLVYLVTYMLAGGPEPVAGPTWVY